MNVTLEHTILAEDGPETVQAQPAAPGLYVYEIPANVDEGAPCRWRLGHHSGLQIARAATAEVAHQMAAALADWVDWTGPADCLKSSILTRENREELLHIVEDCGGHFGNCAHPEPEPDWLPNGGHAGPMCAYVAGISSRCSCG